MTFKELKTTEQPQPKIEKLFGHCFALKEIEQGDKLPVGGDSIFSGEANIETICDLEQFADFFSQTAELADGYDLPNLKKWLNNQGFEFDEALFAKLYAFSVQMEKSFPASEGVEDKRKEYYHEKKHDARLSEVLTGGFAQCAEIAAVAQGYLQQSRVDATYFSGDVVWSGEHEFSGEHSFLVIEHAGKQYIFDPTNPVDTTAGNFPSIYILDKDFLQEMKQGTKKFVKAKNLLSKKDAYFGVNNGTNVDAKRHFVE